MSVILLTPASAEAADNTSILSDRNLTYSPSIQMPRLTKVTFRKLRSGTASATLKWSSSSKGRFYIYRKTKGGKYRVIASVRTDSKKGTYTDRNLKPSKRYVYSVRQIRGKKMSAMDRAGIGTLPAPTLKVTFTNRYARIRWSKVKGAGKYYLYRKCTGSWKKILQTRNLAYTDKYLSLDAQSKKQCREAFKNYIDPAYNYLSYTVRATAITKNGRHKKQSIGAFQPDGEFHLERPTVISADLTGGSADGAQPADGAGVENDSSDTAGVENSSPSASRLLTWGAVPHASAYRILIKRNNTWEIYDDVQPDFPDAPILTAQVPADGTHYSVCSIAEKNGKTVISGYEKHYCVTYEGHEDQNILCVGNSIMAGSPYYGDDTKGLYTIAHRLGSLTGASITNKGKGGACFHYEPITDTYDRRCILTDVIADMGTERLAMYDIVVIEGGTNDYNSGASLGEIAGTINPSLSGAASEKTSSRDTGTVCGAFNAIIDCLEDANSLRIAQGLPAMKAVFFDIPYALRVNSHTKLENRDTTKNARGLTLTDYQRALNTVWDQRAALADSLQFFHYRTRSYNIVTADNCSTWTTDNLHMTKKGYAEYGSSLAKFMIENGILE